MYRQGTSKSWETGRLYSRLCSRKGKQMSLMAWIDYSLIVVFFALVAVLIMVISRPQQKAEAATSALPAVRQNKTAYAFLAILCLFLLSITLLSSKRPQKRAGSAH